MTSPLLTIAPDQATYVIIIGADPIATADYQGAVVKIDKNDTDDFTQWTYHINTIAPPYYGTIKTQPFAYADLEFYENHPTYNPETTSVITPFWLSAKTVGSMCGSVGNFAMSCKEVIKFINTYVERIKLDDDGWNVGDKIPQEPYNHPIIGKIVIYTLPSLLIKFKVDAVLSEKEADEFKKMYYDMYEDNFDEAYDPAASDYEYILLGSAFSALIDTYDGSYRFEDAETDVVGEYYFETE